MPGLFIILTLLSIVGLGISLLKPSLLKLRSRKQGALIFGAGIVVFFIFFGVTTPNPSVQSEAVAAPAVSTTTAVQTRSADNTSTAAADSAAKVKAQKELDAFMALSEKANLVHSYEFSATAHVIYADSIWYTQDVQFKKDFLAKVSMLRGAITGQGRDWFEVRDAYSNEKVAEVTAFSGSLEVYK